MINRRQLLSHTGCGFGMLAHAAMLQSTSVGDDAGIGQIAKAKRVIFLFMQGGVSQVDSFDYKPLLEQRDGEKLSFVDSRLSANTGKGDSQQRVMKSPWKFEKHGQSGQYVSELFPEMAKHVDKLCFVKGMHTEGVAHGPATLFLHCGSTNFVRPSMGSWIQYGLGSENENLPGFVTIAPSMGNGGARNFGNAFLPAEYQGVALGKAGGSVDELKIAFLDNDLQTLDSRRQAFESMRMLSTIQLQSRNTNDDELQASIKAMELAWKLQAVAPEIINIEGESSETLELYGIGSKETDTFGRECLMARRLCEAGVRYVQVTYGDNTANPAWDQHSNLIKHADHARAVDKPIAGLLQDLAQRGLLEDTIVWWGGEFGRTPYAEKNGTGRDHNPTGFTMWLAGGGFRAGFSHGETDEFGHHAIQGKTHMHDLHATILHQLGIDHKKLTYLHAGRSFRLTDVYGRVIEKILA
jgi:hypothetical protein